MKTLCNKREGISISITAVSQFICIYGIEYNNLGVIFKELK